MVGTVEDEVEVVEHVIGAAKVVESMVGAPETVGLVGVAEAVEGVVGTAEAVEGVVGPAEVRLEVPRLQKVRASPFGATEPLLDAAVGGVGPQDVVGVEHLAARSAYYCSLQPMTK